MPFFNSRELLWKRQVFEKQIATRTKISSKENDHEPQQVEHGTSFTREQLKLEAQFIYLIRQHIVILATCNLAFQTRQFDLPLIASSLRFDMRSGISYGTVNPKRATARTETMSEVKGPVQKYKEKKRG